MAAEATRAALMAACEGSILPGNVCKESRVMTRRREAVPRCYAQAAQGRQAHSVTMGLSPVSAAIMSFRPLPARAPAALLREAKPLKALFSAALRLDHLQQLLASQLQPAAREQDRKSVV